MPRKLAEENEALKRENEFLKKELAARKKSAQEQWDYDKTPSLNGKTLEHCYQQLRLMTSSERSDLILRWGVLLPMPQSPSRKIPTGAVVPYKSKGKVPKKPVAKPSFRKGSKTEKVFLALTRTKNGTSPEVAKACGWDVNTVSKLLHHLSERGHIRKIKIGSGKGHVGPKVKYRVAA